MFKKNRNALLEEMRAIARQENGEVFERLSEAGVLSEVAAGVGFDGQRFVSYGTRLLTEAKAREVANEEIDKAFEKRNAEDRSILETLRDRRAAAIARGGEPETEPATTEATEDQRPYKRCACACSLYISSGTESILDASAANASQIFSVSFPSVTDSRMLARMLFASITSPVVAESEAVTSDAPAMTVQENTGAGAVSPSAPAQPRFVRLGASVYDRRHDRFLVAVNEAGAESIVDELNEHQTRVVDFNWEDAK